MIYSKLHNENLITIMATDRNLTNFIGFKSFFGADHIERKPIKFEKSLSYNYTS